MTNNDILRRIRFIFEYSDSQMIEMFTLADHDVTRSQVCDWLKREDDPLYSVLDDVDLAIFLNGFIVSKRGRKEDKLPDPETNLTNNIILRKLKIALNFKDVDILETLSLANMRISKHELSALFRNPNQPQYRPCNDQLLRNFLQGLQIKYKK